MGIGFVLALWAIPLAVVLVVCSGILHRGGAEFRTRRPFAFAATLAAPVIAGAPLALALLGTFLANSDSPGDAYRTVFGRDADECVQLLKGETRGVNDALRVRVVFTARCPDIENRLAVLGLDNAPVSEEPSGSDLVGLGSAADDCPRLSVQQDDVGFGSGPRLGPNEAWDSIAIKRCPAQSLFIIEATWVD